MENKPLSCPFCGSTKILTDIRHQIASFPTPKAIIRINWCTCYECGASSSLDAWQKRALSERHQRLVYLAALAEDYLHHIPLDGKGLGIAIALKEELEDMGIDLKAALEGEE